MNAINLADAKTHLSELVDRVEAGDSIASPGAESRSRGSRPWPRPRKPIDAAQLQSLTASMPLQTQAAADLVRSMRDSDRS
jgi:antitoxin (DNA-binding transcriptional repressor) of toxin-antitoxin stability system